MPIENGKYATRHLWYASLESDGYWWRSGHAHLTEEGEYRPGLEAFSGLLPLWGGAAFVGFTETGWVFWDYDWYKVGNDAYAVNVDVDPVLTVPYPVVPDLVLPTLDASESLVRGAEVYHAAGYGKADAGTNTVVVGPVVQVDGELRLFVLQARQSGKKQSSSISVQAFGDGNKFSLPLRPADELYDLVAFEDESGLYGAEIQYSVSNPLWRRVSAGKPVSLTAAVALSAKNPADGEEENSYVSYLSVVSQTLGTGDPWWFVDVLPSADLTDVVDVVFLVVAPDGVDGLVVGVPAVDASADVVVGGVPAGGVGVPIVLMGTGSSLVVDGVAGGISGLPATWHRQVVRPAGVRGTVGEVSVAVASLTVPAGVDDAVVGGVQVATVSPVVPDGMDESVVGDPVVGSAVLLDVAGRVPPRMSLPRVKVRQKAVVAGVGVPDVGTPTLVASGPSQVVVPDGVADESVGEVALAQVSVLKPAGTRPWMVGWPAIGAETVSAVDGVDESDVGGLRSGVGVSLTPAGVDGSEVGGVEIAAPAVLNVRGVSGGVARTPMVVAESIARVVIVPGLNDAYVAAPEVSRLSQARPAGVDESLVGMPVIGSAVSVDVPGVDASAVGGVTIGDVVLPMVLVVPGVAGGEVALVEVAATVSVAPAGVDDLAVGVPGVVQDGLVLVPGIEPGAVGQVRVRMGSLALLVDWRIAAVVRRWGGDLVPRWSGEPVQRWLGKGVRH